MEYSPYERRSSHRPGLYCFWGAAYQGLRISLLLQVLTPTLKFVDIKFHALAMVCFVRVLIAKFNNKTCSIGL